MTGCSGYKRYQRADFLDWPPPGAPVGLPLETGSTIIISTTDGRRIKGRVDSVDEVSIVVAGRCVQFDRIEALQVRSFLWVPTAALAAGAAMTGAVLLAPEPGFSPDSQAD